MYPNNSGSGHNERAAEWGGGGGAVSILRFTWSRRSGAYIHVE
jgi:hypothetical protein